MDGNAALAGLLDLAPALVLVTARIGALFFTAPLLGGPFLPMRVKVLVTFAIGVLLLPSVQPLLPDPIPVDGRFILLLALELAVGMSVGFACMCIYEGVRAGGELINRYAGFTAAANFDPDSGLGEGPVADLLQIGLVLVFFATNAHHYLLATLALSYAAVPVGGWSLTPELLALAAEGTNQCMAIAAMISFPVLAVILLVITAEGVLAKAVPQINILFLSFALKIFISLFVLWAGMPATVAFMGTTMLAMQRLTAGMVGG